MLKILMVMNTKIILVMNMSNIIQKLQWMKINQTKTKPLVIKKSLVMT